MFELTTIALYEALDCRLIFPYLSKYLGSGGKKYSLLESIYCFSVSYKNPLLTYSTLLGKIGISGLIFCRVNIKSYQYDILPSYFIGLPVSALIAAYFLIRTCLVCAFMPKPWSPHKFI